MIRFTFKDAGQTEEQTTHVKEGTTFFEFISEGLNIDDIEEKNFRVNGEDVANLDTEIQAGDRLVITTLKFKSGC